MFLFVIDDKTQLYKLYETNIKIPIEYKTENL